MGEKPGPPVLKISLLGGFQVLSQGGEAIQLSSQKDRALLFHGGVMNLFWIIGLALFVLFEKLAPAGHRIGRIVGMVLITWGGGLLLVAA